MLGEFTVADYLGSTAFGIFDPFDLFEKTGLDFDPLSAAQHVREFVINALPTSWGGQPLTEAQWQRINQDSAATVAYAAGISNPNVPHSPELDAQYQTVAQQQVALLQNDLAAVRAQVEAEAQQQEPWQTQAFWPLVILAGVGVLAYWISSR